MAGNTDKYSKLQQSLTISTFNTRGFKNKLKRSTLIRKFKEGKQDIIALQEIHRLNETEEQELKIKWGGAIHHSWGSNRSKGLMTMFHPKFDKNCNFSLHFA